MQRGCIVTIIRNKPASRRGKNGETARTVSMTWMGNAGTSYLRVCSKIFGQDCDVPLYRSGKDGEDVRYSRINQQVVGEKMKKNVFEYVWEDHVYWDIDHFDTLSVCRKIFGQDCDVPLYTLCRGDV